MNLEVLKKKIDFLTSLNILENLCFGYVGKVFYLATEKKAMVSDGEFLLETLVDFGGSNFSVDLVIFNKIKKILDSKKDVQKFEFKCIGEKLVVNIDNINFEICSYNEDLDIPKIDEGAGNYLFDIDFDEDMLKKLEMAKQGLIENDISFCGFFHFNDGFLYTTDRRSAFKIKLDQEFKGKVSIISRMFNFLKLGLFYQFKIFENGVFLIGEEEKVYIANKNIDFDNRQIDKLIEGFKEFRDKKINFEGIKRELELLQQLKDDKLCKFLIQVEKNKILNEMKFYKKEGICKSFSNITNDIELKFNIYPEPFLNGLEISEFCLFDDKRGLLLFSGEDVDFVCSIVKE